MSIVKERKQYYLQRKEENEKGIVKGIPWGIVFPKLGSILPVIPPGYQMMLTAGSGIGKSQFWIGLILYSIYKIKKEHPEVKLKVKLIIALLEDTKEMFIDRLYSMLLFDKFKVVVDGFTLQSFTKNSLDSRYIPMLDEVEKDIEELLADCEIIDTIYNPTGVYKACRSISNKYGTHHFVNKEFLKEDKSTYTEKVYSHYEQYDPELQFLLIVDNLNNLAQESKDGKLLTQLETINTWSRNYCRLQITKHWKWSVVNILQQAASSEQQQFTYRGDTIIDKVKPSLDSLGNSKECARDSFIILGIFAPDRFGIAKYPEDIGYDISILRDNFRSLIVLKSNLSKSNVEIPFYFDGAASILRELPSPSEMKDIYVKIKNKTIYS